jgi:pilus assembly protein CpaB
MRSKFILILALAMGAITTFLFFNYMKQFNSEVVISESLVDVVVAKDRILANTKLDASLVEMKKVPKKGIHSQTIKDPSKLEGLYITSPVEAGEVILEHRVQSELEEELFVSRKVKDGYRAVSVGVNFVQSVSNLVEPEDHVDVIFSEIISTNPTQVNTQQIITKARVLAVGRKLIAATETEEEYVEYTSVTLELNPEESVKLVNASERGNIQFTIHTRLLPSGSKEVSKTESSNPSD